MLANVIYMYHQLKGRNGDKDNLVQRDLVWFCGVFCVTSAKECSIQCYYNFRHEHQHGTLILPSFDGYFNLGSYVHVLMFLYVNVYNKLYALNFRSYPASPTADCWRWFNLIDTPGQVS